VNEKTNFIHAVATGVLTGNQVLDYHSAQRSDKRVKPGFTELFDASKAELSGDFRPAFEELWRRNEADAAFVQGARTAIVVSEDPAFDLAKEFERGSQNPTVIVFINPDVAKTWIDYEAMIK
jgi:hypothetical protein